MKVIVSSWILILIGSNLDFLVTHMTKRSKTRLENVSQESKSSWLIDSFSCFYFIDYGPKSKTGFKLKTMIAG